MTESERIEYQAETARLRAANVARVQQDAVNQRAYDKATRDALQALRDTDHAAALLDNLPCELCGQVELSPNHRGIGHTHTPAVTFVDRAALFLNTTTDSSGHIADTARMILGNRNPREVVDLEHAVALEIDRTVYPLLRGLGEPHPAEPHSRRPTECRACGRLIVGRFEDGIAISYTHREKASTR